MTTQPTRDSWFSLGAKKFRGWALTHGAEELLPDDDTQVYVCPLCTRGITENGLLAGVLSAEDVPPESVGGRKILLTCKKPCNNDQGSAIDTHAPRRERWLDSHTGGPVTPVRGEHTVGGVTVRGRIWPGGGGYGFECVPEWNDPRVYEAYLLALKDRDNRNHSYREMPGFVPEKADLPYIRAAYLASFAVFGYSHILRPSFRELRQWLAAGSHPTELPPILRTSLEETSRANSMFIVTEPGPHYGTLLVTMGRYMVVLPGPEDDRTLDQVAADLEAVVPNGEEGTFTGHLIPWPTKPQHLGDPDPPEEGDLDAA